MKQYLQQLFNLRSINFMINTYIECLGYLFPVLIAYLWTQSLKNTLFILIIVILIRFIVAFYEIKKTQ